MLQVEAIDDELRNRLWNVILEDFFYKIYNQAYSDSNYIVSRTCKILWKDFFNKPIDTIPSYSYQFKESRDGFITFTRKWFYSAEWYELYDLVEAIASFDEQIAKLEFTNACNEALKKEVSGYRLVNANIVQITSAEEIQEIEDALNSTDKWTSVNTHLQTALELLANRKTPDYRNSIKESISAVESLCIIITDDKSASLGKALILIEKTHSLHGALKSSFSALYGYTSDSGGIRHALIEGDSPVNFEDAKFMLVSCSAFINYLKTKMKVS